MITISASYTVVPNESTPRGRLWLSDMDQVVRLSHTPLIYIYKAKANHDAMKRLRNSLAMILVHYYPVAGRLCWTQGSRLELDLNAKGAVLLEAETTKTMGDYGDFSPSDTTKELVPVIDYNQPMEDIPLFVVQLTRFHGNEGLAVGVALSHPLSDGVGWIRFINSWAKIARLGTLETHEIPYLDRTELKFSHPPLAPRFDHLELKPLPLILGRSDTTVERNKNTTAELLKLSKEQVEKLKKKANEVPKQQGSRPYSRFEAIGAHIWKCASKARDLHENQPTVVRFNVEIRNRIIPHLHQNYFGNALIQTAAKACNREITSQSLGCVAQKIREATEMVTDKYIRSQIDVIRGQEHLDNARVLFLGGEGKNAVFSGNPNLHLTSWMSLPAYEADFGWGKPVYFGLGYVSPHDRGLILSSSDGDGSVIVCMHFQVEHMQLFKKFFYGDIYELFTASRL